ncbi:MAG: hypothetical protein ABIH21_03900 [Patescibacteria group bacterium]
MRFYNISKGQYITIWVFGVIVFLLSLSGFGAYPFYIFKKELMFGILVLGFLIFYSIGWCKQNKKDMKVEKFDEKSVKIRCTNCNKVSKPTKWIFRMVIGIILLVGWGLVPGFLFLIFSSKFICPDCGQRHMLNVVLENGSEQQIKAMPKSRFLLIWIPITIIFVLASLAASGLILEEL